MSNQIKAKSLKAGDEVVGIGVVREALISYPQIRVEYESGRISYYMQDAVFFVTRGNKK